VVGRCHNGQRVGGEGNSFAVQVARRAAHHHQVGLVAGQHAQNVFAVVNLELNVDALKQLAKLHQQHGYEVFGGADHSQVDTALFQADVVGHLGFQILELPHGGLGVQ
jgi:hypothetical protein